MCGIIGVISSAPVNQLIYDALLLLQHRGQDAAGIVTQQGRKFFMHKAKGMVRDVFRTRNMRSLPGNVGLGQVRYQPTLPGSARILRVRNTSRTMPLALCMKNLRPCWVTMPAAS